MKGKGYSTCWRIWRNRQKKVAGNSCRISTLSRENTFSLRILNSFFPKRTTHLKREKKVRAVFFPCLYFLRTFVVNAWFALWSIASIGDRFLRQLSKYFVLFCFHFFFFEDSKDLEESLLMPKQRNEKQMVESHQLPFKVFFIIVFCPLHTDHFLYYWPYSFYGGCFC